MSTSKAFILHTPANKRFALVAAQMAKGQGTQGARGFANGMAYGRQGIGTNELGCSVQLQAIRPWGEKCG